MLCVRMTSAVLMCCEWPLSKFLELQQLSSKCSVSAIQRSRKMLRNHLEQVFQHHADVVDLTTWCRCRAASKDVNKYTMDNPSENTHMYRCKQIPKRMAIDRVKQTMSRMLDEAAEHARQMISTQRWSQDRPRCCSRYCYNNCNAQTGIWAPLHVVIARESPENATTVNTLWWRNEPAVRDRYLTCSPQQKITTFMKEWKRDYLRSEIKFYYVACSESCLHDVKESLDIIHWRNPEEFHVFIGVEKTVLKSDQSRSGDFWRSESSESSDASAVSSYGEE